MGNIIKKHEGNMPDIFNKFFGNELFNNLFDGDVPAVNVIEKKESFELEMAVPGYSKEDFSLKVDKNILTISGKKSTEKEDKDEHSKVLRREFSSNSFMRSFTLPQNVDTDHIDASQKDGVLNISLPKLMDAKEDKVKKIEVK